MRRSLRELATRHGIDQIPAAQAFYRGGASARYFERGYRYAKRFPVGSRPPVDRARELSPLERYANAHTEGPGLFKWDHYFDIYDRHLSRFRGEAVHLVEIGVAGGGSLGMWRDYLGPSAHIVGVDIDPECTRFGGDGVDILIGDQGDPAFWGSFVTRYPDIDIVIDDGGHLPAQQAVTLECLLPQIAPGGVYACEDIHGPFQPFQAFIDGLTRPLSDVPSGEVLRPANSLQRQVASVHRYPLVTVIEKRAWSRTDFEPKRYGSQWPGGWTEASDDGG
jgi:hypothetical protein